MALEITYYSLGKNKNCYGAPILSETRSLSGTSAQSAATPDNAEIVRIHATEAARYAYGSNPTATAAAGASGHYLASGATIDIHARSAYLVAGIQAA